jgi:hypothetical protein
MSALPPQELHGTRCLTHPVVPHASPLSRHLNISTQDPVAHPPERTGHRTERRPSGHRHTQRKSMANQGSTIGVLVAKPHLWSHAMYLIVATPTRWLVTSLGSCPSTHGARRRPRPVLC